MQLNNYPAITVFNKIDLLKEKTQIPSLTKEFPASVFISAARHIQIEKLKRTIVDFIEKKFVECEVELPMEHSALVSFIYSNAIVTGQVYNEDRIAIKFKCTLPVKEKIIQTVEKKTQLKKETHLD
jgi:GTP-binding protein HflX